MQKLNRMYRCSRLILLVCSLVATQATAETRDPESFFFNESFGDFAEELVNAKDEGKKGVLLMFQQADCPYCHRMRTTVVNQKRVQDYYRENFLIFHVDIEGDIEITDFNGQQLLEKDFAFRKNRVRATPVFAFYDLDGKRVARYTGATTDVDEFMLLGKYVVDGKYNTMSFNRYKREQQK